MAAITVRQLPEEAKRRLRLRAAAHDRSMEAEAREILRHASALRIKMRKVEQAVLIVGFSGER